METQNSNSPEQMKLRAELAKKINKIGVEIGKLKPDGTNDFSKYKYISAEQMNAEIREKGEQFGVCIIPSILESAEQSFSTTDEKGKVKVTIRTNVKMAIDVIDTETGYCMPYYFTGSDQDTGGKSEQQAITQCFKYFLFKLFKISTKDDQDGDSKTQEITNQKPQAVQQKTQTVAKPKVKLTVEGLQKVIDKVKAGDVDIWEKNKALYEYSAEQEEKINDAVKSLGKH
jgi:hypothetical protein